MQTKTIVVCDCPMQDALVCKQYPTCRLSYCRMRLFDTPIVEIKPEGEPKVGDEVYVRLPSMHALQYQDVPGFIHSFTSDGSVNVYRDYYSDRCPVAFGQPILRNQYQTCIDSGISPYGAIVKTNSRGFPAHKWAQLNVL